MDLGVRLRLILLFAMGTASSRRGKQHDSDRRHGLSHPGPFVESNRAIPVSSIHVFIRLGPAFEVEDWYVRSGGRRHLCL